MGVVQLVWFDRGESAEWGSLPTRKGTLQVRAGESKSWASGVIWVSKALRQHWKFEVLTYRWESYIMRSTDETEKAMAPHSSTFAWKIPWMEEPGGLQPMGLLRVGHDWATSLSLFTFMHWRRKWQPTPVFLPGESQGRGSLVGCRLWDRTESDTTEVT